MAMSPSCRRRAGWSASSTITGGKPIVSPALFEPIGDKFRRDIKDWAQANGIPVIRFRAGERKADVMAPYLDAAAAAGRSQVAAIGCAQEFQLVWTARKRDTDPGRCPQFSFTKEQRRVPVFYVYIWDNTMGSGFIKICTYFPYPVKAWVNGHEWAKRQALAAGIGFTALSNGFASCDDPAGLQAICDRFGPGTVQLWFERWMARIPLPLTDADRDAGYWWELSMRQTETSRTLVFDDGVHARAFFEALLCENMDLGRPENAELLFRRGQRLGLPTIPPGWRRVQDQDRPVLPPGHHQRVLQELQPKAVPQRRRRAAHRDRHQRPPRPGLQQECSSTCPSCKPRRVRSAPGCCTLKPPARARHL